jgi:hypothetical protein
MESHPNAIKWSKNCPYKFSTKSPCPLPTVNREKLQDIKQQPSRSCVGIVTLQISFLVPNLASVNLVLSPKNDRSILIVAFSPFRYTGCFWNIRHQLKGELNVKNNESLCKHEKHYVHPCSNSNFTARWVCLSMIMTIITIGLSIMSVSSSVRTLNRTTS